MFRPVLEKSLGRPPRWKGGRPPFDPVLKFRMVRARMPLVRMRARTVQSLHGLSLEQTEYPVRDRLSWMRLGPARSRGPGAGCEHPVGMRRIRKRSSGPFPRRMRGSDRGGRAGAPVRAPGPRHHGGRVSAAGQIVDASLVAAPRQRNTDGERERVNATGPKERANAIKEGRSAAEIWPDKPAKARQKDVDGRWTVTYSKAKVRADGKRPHAPLSLGPMARQGASSRSRSTATSPMSRSTGCMG